MKRFLLLALSLGLALPVTAAPVTQTEIKHKSRDLNKVTEELNRKRQEQEQLKKEASELSKSLEEGEVKIRGVEEALLHTLKKTSDLQQDLASTKNKRDRAAKEIGDTRSVLKKSIRTYYVSASLSGPSVPSSVWARQAYRLQSRKLAGLQDLRDSEEQNFSELTMTYQAIQREVDQQQSALDRMKTGKTEKQKLLEKKLTRKQIIEGELRELKQTAEELASLIDVLRSRAKQEKEQDKKERQQKVASGQSPIAPRSLPWPVSGKVIEKFGRHTHPELATTYMSNGIVIEVNAPTTVQAVGDGHVLYAGDFMSYGFMTVVEHPGDWYSVYGRLSKWNVEKGQQVKLGDPLGQTGISDTGTSEAYFELRFYGKPTDPLPWLGGN